MSSHAVVFVYAAATLAASLIGGWVPLWTRMTHARTHLMMSLVAGLMLGVGVFHMLPHAAAETGSVDRSVQWLMAGLLAMFFLQRFSHFHQHEMPEAAEPEHEHHETHIHGAACDHKHESPRSLGWTGIAVGLTLHTLMDGMALAASVEAEADVAGSGGWMGLGTFLAVFLHKPLDAMAVSAMMISSRVRPAVRQTVNALFALVCPLGAALFYVTLGRLAQDYHAAVGCALAFSAGVFLCISLGDLLPELQFHSHDRWKLSAALLLGIGLAYGIGFFENEHLHGQLPAGHAHGAHDE